MISEEEFELARSCGGEEIAFDRRLLSELQGEDFELGWGLSSITSAIKKGAGGLAHGVKHVGKGTCCFFANQDGQ
jgi:hypothetical protein